MKKLLSIFTAAALMLSMGMSAMAATPAALKDVDSKNFAAVLKANGEKGLILLDKTKLTTAKLSDLTPTPGQELKIYLTANMFVDNQGTNIAATIDDSTHLSRTQIRNGKVELKRASSRGSKAFDKVTMSYDKVGTYISVKFVDPFVSVEELDFSTILYLSVNGTKKKATEITVAGTFSPDIVEVFGDDDYVDLSSGQVAEAVERNPKIEVDFGNDLSVVTSMVKGRKYYASCTTDVSLADGKILAKYPGIDMVYTLKTINLKGGNKSVYINSGDRMYVYDATGIYLGTSDKMLNYSTKYYLSSKKYTSITVK